MALLPGMPGRPVPGSAFQLMAGRLPRCDAWQSRPRTHLRRQPPGGLGSSVGAIQTGSSQGAAGTTGVLAGRQVVSVAELQAAGGAAAAAAAAAVQHSEGGKAAAGGWINVVPKVDLQRGKARVHSSWAGSRAGSAYLLQQLKWSKATCCGSPGTAGRLPPMHAHAVHSRIALAMHPPTSRYTGRPSQPTASTRSPVRRSGMATVRPSAVVTVAEAGKQTHWPASEPVPQVWPPPQQSWPGAQGSSPAGHCMKQRNSWPGWKARQDCEPNAQKGPGGARQHSSVQAGDTMNGGVGRWVMAGPTAAAAAGAGCRGRCSGGWWCTCRWHRLEGQATHRLAAAAYADGCG